MTECDLCGETLSGNPLSGPAHARKHKNQFEELVGLPPNSYDEVRALFLDGELPDDIEEADIAMPATLDEFLQEADGDE